MKQKEDQIKEELGEKKKEKKSEESQKLATVQVQSKQDIHFDEFMQKVSESMREH